MFIETIGISSGGTVNIPVYPLQTGSSSSIPGSLFHLASAIGAFLVALYTHRRSEGIGVRSFSIISVSLGILNLVLIIGFGLRAFYPDAFTSTHVTETVLSVPAYVLVTALIQPVVGNTAIWIYMLAYLIFIFVYTKRIDIPERRLLIWFLVPSGFVVLTLGSFANLRYAGLVSVGPHPDQVRSVASFLTLVVLFSSALIAMIRTFNTYKQYTQFSRGLMTAFLLIPAWLFVTLVSSAVGVSIGTNYSVILDPIGHIVSTLALGFVVIRFDAFERLPAASAVAREDTIEDLSDGVVVIDRQDRVVDINPRATSLLHSDADDVIGEPLGAVLPERTDSETLLAGERTEFDRTGKTIQASVSDMTDGQDRLLGRSIVLHDVTESQRREQRIQVLNRVLRHNLRNDLNVVRGYAESLKKEVPDATEYAVPIQEMSSELISLGEKAQEIEEIFAAKEGAHESTVEEAIERAVNEVCETHSDCRISVSVEATDEIVTGAILTPVIRELLENGCQHNDADEPRVEVTATTVDGEYPVSVRVADNGPGIPEREITPIEEGTETPLEHGSGVGFWLVNWGVAMLSGEIEFESNERRGTVVTLRIPAAD